MINSYKAPSFNDELLTLTHQIAGFLSQMVPVDSQDGPRKIVQIAATAEPGAESDLLYALCNDGTLWFMPPQAKGALDVWRKVRDIPQEDE